MIKQKDNWTDRECIECNTKFKCLPNRAKKNLSKFCSRKCNIKHNLIGRKKENNRNWKGGISENNYHYKLLQIKRYPERIRARYLVHQAKKSGRLIPTPCFICGDDKVNAHHEDYSKPLEVKWMCRKCHRKEHGGNH